MSLVTLKNDFHNTSINIRCEVLSHIHHTATIYPTKSQIRKAKKVLCGSPECTCSDPAGTRGPQEVNGKRLVVDCSAAYPS